MSRRIAIAATGALLALSACKPIERPHTYDYDYPQQRSDFAMRWLGTPSGVAMWVTTADDGEQNGRYEGISVLVDPGTPSDVETVVLPHLAENGLPPAARHRLAYVVLTSADAPSIAGAERVVKAYPGTQIVTAGRTGKTKLPSANTLTIGPEVSARVLRPDGAGGVDAQALLLRFIDVAILVLPSHADGLAGALAEHFGAKLEKEGLRVTVVYAANGKPIEPAKLEHLEPEVVVGGSDTGGLAVHLPTPKSGEVVELGTNGSEMSASGPRLRSRYGHWLDCEGAKTCGADLPLQGSGPILVPVKLTGQDEGLFLVDTRAPFSYLVRKRFEKIPGWEKAEHAGHSHAAASVGLEVPPFEISGGGRSVRVHRWHVLPIEPFQIGGKDVAGVIGLDLLQSFRIELLPKEKRVSWTPNFAPPREHLGKAETKTDAGRATWDVPMDRSPGGPLILATMDGEVKSLVVDLAAEKTRVYVRAESWPKVSAPAKQELWLFVVPDEIDEAGWKKWELNAGSLTVKELNLFGAKFPDTPALAIDRPLEADVIGLDFLRTFDRVSMDFRRRSIVLERSNG